VDKECVVVLPLEQHIFWDFLSGLRTSNKTGQREYVVNVVVKHLEHREDGWETLITCRP
jgi:hypothetical protein